MVVEGVGVAIGATVAVEGVGVALGGHRIAGVVGAAVGAPGSIAGGSLFVSGLGAPNINAYLYLALLFRSPSSAFAPDGMAITIFIV